MSATTALLGTNFLFPTLNLTFTFDKKGQPKVSKNPRFFFESVCEGFLLKHLLLYSSANHHHLIIIIVISSSSSSSSSSSHHHLIIIIFSSSSHHHQHHLSPLSLSLAFLFFSILAQPSSHEKRARCNPSQGKCVSSVKNWGVFAIFQFLEQPSAGIRLSSVKNWVFFASFGVPGAPLSGQTRVECQKLMVFLVCPEVSWGLCWRFVLPHTAVFSREEKWAKIAKKSQKLVVFGDFFVFEATLCGNPAVECQKLFFFCDFAVPESVLTICFASYGLLQTLSRGEKRWFQTSLKPVWNGPDGFRLVSDYSETHLFLKRRLRNGRMIRFESYGGLKLPQIGPDDLFFYTRPLQGHPEPSSDGFRGVSEWFQKGFRMVSEGSETAWFQSGFRGSETAWFQSGFRGSETAWFQRGFRGSETVWFQRGFRGVWNHENFIGWFWTKTFENLLRRLSNDHWRDVAINFQKSSSKITQWKIIPNFYWEIARMKLSKKHFGRIAIFHSKNLLGEAPKNLKKSLGSIQTKKNTFFFIGKSITKRNIEETIWQNRLIRKKNPHWRDVAINFQKSSSKIIQWKIIPILYRENAQRKRKNIW